MPVPGTIDEGEMPDEYIIQEVEEETGYRIENAIKIYDAYLSPGSIIEMLYFFVAEYNTSMRKSKGGGTDKTEDIDVKEMPFTDAVNMIKPAEIKDAKTITLLPFAQTQNLFS